ncbi:gamma-tubulin complex component 2 homolog [Drosophila nasuta]|uniref:gamma-tubulin complex component 2 homolog n=1 Tax=Drosophila nasuta TaxID=42062 RepID=UPI00295E37D0|nr:gamma-tubulin complex component 2 homolog [Drosophila nasuta]
MDSDAEDLKSGESSSIIMEQGDDKGDASSQANHKKKTGSWIFETVGGYYLPKENLSKLSAKEQEQLLIRDLIYAFSGVPASHIRPDLPIDMISLLKTAQIDEVRFKIDENFSGAFRALGNELLPLIGYYINVQSFIEDTVMSKSCYRTLGVALHRNIQSYFELLSTLETQLQQQKLNLQQLVKQLRPWVSNLQSLASVTSHARRSECSIAALLSMMYEQQQHFKSSALKQVLTAVSDYYMKMVQLWTQKGVLYDVRGDFFVEDTHATAMSSTLLSPKQCCHAFWQQRYKLHLQRLPSFLEPQSEKIFLAGKYLNVLRQCNVQMQLMQMPLSYVFGDEAHVEFIRSSYELPARKLLDILKDQGQLQQHLSNLLDYVLLQQNQFVESLLEKCAEQLQRPVDSLVPEKLQKLLLETLQSSSNPYKHMLQLQLMDCDVVAQLEHREQQEKSSDELTSEEDQLPEPLNITGYESISLRYTPNWPISLVLHEESLQQLQLVQRVLFLLRYVQHHLQSITYNLSKWNPLAAELRDRMNETIKQVEQHLLLDVLEPRWQRLLQAVEKAQLVDDVIRRFELTVKQCVQLCLLSEPVSFVRSLFTLGQMCLNFCGFIEQPTEAEFDAGLFEYDGEFTSLLQSLLNVIEHLANSSQTDDNERESCKQLLDRIKFDRRSPKIKLN